MKNRIQAIARSDFFTSSVYSSISVLVKIATAFIVGKVIAIYLGPAGMGLLGQLTSIVAVAILFSGGILVNATIKLVAEYNANNKELVKPLLQTISGITLLLTLATSVLLFLGSEFLASKFLYNANYGNAIKVLALAIWFVSFNTVSLAVLNGLKDFKTYNILNAANNLVGLVTTVALIYCFGTSGAVYGTIVSQAIGFVVVFFAVKNKYWLSASYLKPLVDRAVLRPIAKLATMMLVTALTTPLVQLAVRNHIIKTQNINNAGIWEAVNKISTIHLLFFLTVLTTYYLPKLSELNTKVALRAEIVRGYKMVVPVILSTSITLFLLKDSVIAVLYSAAFSEAAYIMFWQIVGDFFKIMSFLLAFIMIAKSLSITYILSEIGTSALYYMLVLSFTYKLGIQGATVAYAATYFLYFIFLLIRFHKLLLKINEGTNTYSWFL